MSDSVVITIKPAMERHSRARGTHDRGDEIDHYRGRTLPGITS